jgi:hypothetical protein
MGAPISEVSYISATTGRRDHEVFMDFGGIGGGRGGAVGKEEEEIEEGEEKEEDEEEKKNRRRKFLPHTSKLCH